MDHSSRRSFTAAQAQFGDLLLGTGIGIFGLAAWDNNLGLPWTMPSFWHSQRSICLVIAFACVVLGLFVASRGPRETSGNDRNGEWTPTQPGRRFQTVRVYSREGCHLCDEAVELLNSYSAYLPEIQEIDIDTNSDLKAQFDVDVPVVEIDGKVRFKGRVSESLLRRLLEGTSPEEDSAT